VDKAALIDALGLEPHLEGGYFRRTFQADHRPQIDTGAGPRFTLTSIYYLLTDDSPCGRWHRNRSDILHYYHLGAPLSYYLIHPDGTLETVVLGPDIAAGERLQLAVPGGVWKASHLPGGEYGLVSEAVAPGFDYEDMTPGDAEVLLREFPRHRELIERFSPGPGTRSP
jgi:predicted cupin superfamily sugar epimerase